jgi:DNA-binding winged helix-turn-helix (wHTH) protein/tetratricopeptide (TPR) repeat protein
MAQLVEFGRFPHTRSIVFGEFELDLRDHILRATDGTLVRLQPQPLKVLVLLASRPNELVTREEIRTQVWGNDVFVDFEHGLNYSIKQIRHVLHDDPQNPTYIQTIPKRGYRFIGEIRRVERDPDRVDDPTGNAEQSQVAADGTKPSWIDNSRKPILAIGVVIVAVIVVFSKFMVIPVPAKNVVPPIRAAILPFQALSDTSDERRFASLLSEQMLADLSRIEPSRVQMVSGLESGVVNASKTVGIDYWVQGTVNLDRTPGAVEVRLTKSTDASVVWSSSFPFSRDAPKSPEVFRAISQAIALQLLPIQQQRLAKAATPSADAFENYMRGRDLLFKGAEPDPKRAIEFFERSLQSDAKFAYSYSAQAIAYRMLGTPLDIESARRSARKALELDKNQFVANEILAEIALLKDWNLPETRRQLDRAIALFPWRPRTYKLYALYFAALDKHEDAEYMARRAAAMDPLSLGADANLGYLYFLQRRFSDAAAEFERTLRIYPNREDTRRLLIFSYIVDRRWDAAKRNAITLMKHARAQSGPIRSVEAASSRDAVHKFLRWDSEGLRSRVSDDEAQDILSSEYALLGEKDAAFEALDQTLVRRGLIALFVKQDATFDSLRREPRYQQYLIRIASQISRGG